MSHFLFIVGVPSVPQPSAGLTESPKWASFQIDVEGNKKLLKAAERIQSNGWLIASNGNWPTIKFLSDLAEGNALSYSILLIDGVTDMTGKNPRSAVIENLRA